MKICLRVIKVQLYEVVSLAEKKEEIRTKVSTDIICAYCCRIFSPKNYAVYCSEFCEQAAYEERKNPQEIRLVVLTLPESGYFDKDGHLTDIGVRCSRLMETLKELEKLPIAEKFKIEKLCFGTDEFWKFVEIYQPPHVLPYMVGFRMGSLRLFFEFARDISAEDISFMYAEEFFGGYSNDSCNKPPSFGSVVIRI